jgi:hypothetical protein
MVESPDKWHFPYFNDEMGAAIGAAAAGVDAYLMGAFSTTTGPPTARARRRALRRRPQRDLREGLLDELNLLVHPIVVGEGLTGAR